MGVWGAGGQEWSWTGWNFGRTRFKVTVKGLEGLEEGPPDCEETTLKVRAEVRIRVRGSSPSCAEGWRDWRKRLIYWCRW